MSNKYKIHLKPNAIPFACYVPRKIAHPLVPKVKAELDRMEKLGVISKVDPLKLNENIIREGYPLPSVDQILAQLSGSKVFTKLDCNSRFWQILLTKESSLLTTFITPFGKYCYNVLPFGISPVSEHYQKVMKENLSDCE